MLKSIGDTLDRILVHPFTLRLGYALINLFNYWPVLFRAGLYFLIGALPSMVKAANEFGNSSRDPNAWILTSVIGEAVYQGLVTLRAYFDGSATRLMPQKKNGDTVFFSNPNPPTNR